jgi:hypothetical protein
MQNQNENSALKQRPPANKGFSHQTSNMQYGASYMKPMPSQGGGALNAGSVNATNGVTPKVMITGSVLTPSKSTLEESKTPSNSHLHRNTVMGTTAERIFGVGNSGPQHSAAKHMSTNQLNNNSATHLMGSHIP